MGNATNIDLMTLVGSVAVIAAISFQLWMDNTKRP